MDNFAPRDFASLASGHSCQDPPCTDFHLAILDARCATFFRNLGPVYQLESRIRPTCNVSTPEEATY